ncbi:unnamed protein product [Laminaria digitata]
MRKATSFLLLPTVCLITFHTRQASAAVYKVVPDASSSDGDNGGGDGEEVYSLLDALDRAQGGDTIALEDDTYTDRIKSTAAGEEGNPIVISGGRGAVLKASSPCVKITHSWITLEGFSIDGKTGSEEEFHSYQNKCVIVNGEGESEDDAVDGFVMKDMLIICKSAPTGSGECVGLKNFVINPEIAGNTIRDCGVHSFVFGSDPENKNGEGIYIGTSLNQWTFAKDRCNGNLVRGNVIATNGNECVEAKEGSFFNIIEENICSNQEDSESGCFSARGDANTIRYIQAEPSRDVFPATDCRGAGVRLGGWTNEETGYEYGQMNNVYGNTFVRAIEAAITVRVVPQGWICDNTCEDGPCDIEK